MATLYPGIPFSPQATLAESIGEADTIIKVSDVSSAWADNRQTVRDPELLSAAKYVYVVTPASASYGSYASCMVSAGDVTTDGEITFSCEDVPTVELTVIITRIEVDNG